MLEYRREGPLLVLEQVPRRLPGRLVLGFARVVAAPSDQPVHQDLAQPRPQRLAALAYLLPLLVAAVAGAGARRFPASLFAGLVAAVVLVVVAYVVVLRSRRLLAVRRRVLRHRVSETVLLTASVLATRALLSWPHVTAVLACPDLRDVLERTLWDLGGRLRAVEGHRDRVAAYTRAVSAAPGPHLRTELTRQRSGAEAMVLQTEREVARCLADLRRLCEAFDAFRTRAAGPAASSDVSRLADCAETVASAYRDLIGRQ